MVWFKVDDNLAFHSKTVMAGNAAMGLWVRAGSWSAQQLTEGSIPGHIVAALGTTAQAKALVRAGLWVQTGDGYQFWQWSEEGRQPSKESVLTERAAAKERQRKAREKASASRRDNSVTDGVTSGEVTVPPSRPVPTTTYGGDISISPVPEREGSDLDGDESLEVVCARQAESVYGADFHKIRNAVGRATSRIPNPRDVIRIIAYVHERAHKPIKSPTGIVLSSLERDWAEWQKFLDEEGAA